MDKKQFPIGLAGMITAFLVIFSFPRGAFSQGAQTQLVVSPAQATATTCEDVQIAIGVEQVVDLTGYSLKLSFPAEDIEVLEVSNAGFLKDGLFEPGNAIDNIHGSVSFGMVQQNSLADPMTPKSGSGNLVILRLRALNPGKSAAITLDPQASILVKWPEVVAIPFTTADGVVSTQSCAPSSITLTGSAVEENLPAGAPVGSFSTEDPDLDTTFTYTLVEPGLYPDNLNFTLSIDGQLATAAVLDYEQDPSQTIKVRSTDEHGAYFERVFTIDVQDVNDPPVLAAIGGKTVDEETELTFSASATDEDLPANVLTFRLEGTVPAGASITPQGMFTWTPTEAQGPGSYSFDLVVSDGSAEDRETVAVTVVEVNKPPVADSQSVTLAEDSTRAITLAAGDSDSPGLTWTIVKQPAHGQLSGTPPKVTYTPAKDYTGSDSFTFKVNDGEAGSNTATVSITVTPVNDPPAAVADAYQAQEDQALAVKAPGVLGNDRDVDGDALRAALVSEPGHGTVDLKADGSFTYTPEADFAGVDSFEYKARDAAVESPAVKVTITVSEQPDGGWIYLPLMYRE